MKKVVLAFTICGIATIAFGTAISIYADSQISDASSKFISGHYSRYEYNNAIDSALNLREEATKIFTIGIVVIAIPIFIYRLPRTAPKNN